MTSSKQRILERLTKSIKPQVAGELQSAPPSDKPGNRDQFIAQLKQNNAEVIASTAHTLTDNIRATLKADGLRPTLVSRLEIIPTESGEALPIRDQLMANGVTLTDDPGKAADSVGFSMALTGISDTGTLVLTSSPQNPTAINFLVEHHWVVLRSKDIVANLQSAITKLEHQGYHTSSRAINFISGPSRTADIEQTIQLGAHGPRSLRVFII